MVTAEGLSIDSDVEFTGRLKDRDLHRVYHWCVSEDQRGDILRKRSVAAARRAWIQHNTYISNRSAKGTDELLKKHVLSRPRQKVDKTMAKLVLAAKDNAARAAGFDAPTSTTNPDATTT